MWSQSTQRTRKQVQPRWSRTVIIIVPLYYKSTRARSYILAVWVIDDQFYIYKFMQRSIWFFAPVKVILAEDAVRDQYYFHRLYIYLSTSQQYCRYSNFTTNVSKISNATRLQHSFIMPTDRMIGENADFSRSACLSLTLSPPLNHPHQSPLPSPSTPQMTPLEHGVLQTSCSL